ncbi:MAG: hypothetical protein PQJ46_09360 [Spirochaetales bacterium]|nr:hypothetical protein [Spirochaetales bacterium]
MTELQKLVLRDVFRQAGLDERKIEDIFLLLRFKPEKVQLAFYYISTGATQKAAGDEIGVTQQQIGKYLKKCNDIKEYLKSA